MSLQSNFQAEAGTMLSYRKTCGRSERPRKKEVPESGNLFDKD